MDTLADIASALDVEVVDLVSLAPAAQLPDRLSTNDYVTVREAVNSIETVLKRFKIARPRPRRRPRR